MSEYIPVLIDRVKPLRKCRPWCLVIALLNRKTEQLSKYELIISDGENGLSRVYYRPGDKTHIYTQITPVFKIDLSFMSVAYATLGNATYNIDNDIIDIDKKPVIAGYVCHSASKVLSDEDLHILRELAEA